MDRLVVRLLNRTTRRVSLTEIGRDYYERCVQILHDLEEADEAAGALQLTPRGELRVYCHHGVSRFVAPIVTGFFWLATPKRRSICARATSRSTWCRKGSTWQSPRSRRPTPP